ncbi:MAG: hypothetical protein AB7G17_11995 [Phycisphaerales bacterium]
MRRLFLSAIAVACALCAPVSAQVQPPRSLGPLPPKRPDPPKQAAEPKTDDEKESGERPEAARRIVRVFDFEERPWNPEPVPQHWFRAQHDPPSRERAGYPAWNQAAFDTSLATSGAHSILLPTRGGSTSLRLSGGVLAAIPTADYAITARVRTDGLAHAGARLRARFLNERLDVIESSEAVSRLIRSPDKWTEALVELDGDTPGAAWIQIDLELLQPRELEREHLEHIAASEDPQPPSALVTHRAIFEDISGGAYFDDLTIMQVPRVRLRSTIPGAVAAAPDKPTYELEVRDLTGEPLRVHMIATDLDGNLVDSLDAPAPEAGQRLTWSPAMQQYGWIRVNLEVVGPSGVVARSSSTAVWLPPLPRADSFSSTARETARFGLTADDARVSQLRDLPDVARALSLGALVLPAWDGAQSRATLRADINRLDAAVERAIASGQEVTLALARTPEELSRSLVSEPGAVWDALTAPPAQPNAEPPWAPYLWDVLSKFGQRVRRWQVGLISEPLAFWRPNLSTDLDSLEQSFGRLAPRPVIVVPWSIDHALDDRFGSGRWAAALAPPAATQDAISSFVSQASSRAGATIIIEPLDESTYGPRATVIDTAKRAASAWAAAPNRLSLRHAWDWRSRTGPELDPRPSLAVWRQLAERLGGRRIVGELPLAPGARALILDGPRGGALFAWNDYADPDDALIHMRLAEDPVRIIDLFGNEQSATRINNLDRITLSETPVFVEGIDVPLALFRGSFIVDPARVEAEAALHAVEFVLHNPWPVTISGTLRITDPKGWKIEPRVISFDIPAGGQRRIPAELSFGLGEEAGLKHIVADVDVLADRRHSNIRLAAPLEVGLASMQLTPSYAMVPSPTGGPPDVVITLSVTNSGQNPETVKVFVIAPGFPSEQAPVSSLGPGETAVRRFRFPNAAPTLLNKRIRVGLIDVEGIGRLNKSLVIQ